MDERDPVDSASSPRWERAEGRGVVSTCRFSRCGADVRRRSVEPSNRALQPAQQRDEVEPSGVVRRRLPPRRHPHGPRPRSRMQHPQPSARLRALLPRQRCPCFARLRARSRNRSPSCRGAPAARLTRRTRREAAHSSRPLRRFGRTAPGDRSALRRSTGDGLPLRVELLERLLRLVVAGGRLGRAARVLPRGRVGELLLERAQVGLGGLDLLLQLAGAALLVLRRAVGLGRLAAARASAGFGALGGRARASARSSRTRRYSGQPPTYECSV